MNRELAEKIMESLYGKDYIHYYGVERGDVLDVAMDILDAHRPEMDEARAREILAPMIQDDGSLRVTDEYFIAWHKEQPTVCMDGYFLADELRAIAWWMTHMKGEDDGKD